MALGARSKFGGPMFKLDVCRKQVYCVSEESSLLVTLLGLSGEFFHIFCVHILYFSTYKYTLCFFSVLLFFFCTSLISFL